MKLISKLILLIFFIPVCSFADLGEKSPMLWTVVKEVKDTSVKAGMGMFEITLSENSAGLTKLVSSSVKYGYNKTTLTEKPDAKGKLRLKLKPGKYQLAFFLNESYGEITTDSIKLKAGYRTEIEIYFHKTEAVNVCFKPVIYVYPEKKKEVEIILKLSGDFSFTYPEYKNGWKFIADTNGRITQNGKSYDYLFWEGKTDLKINDLDLQQKFIVSSNELTNFFETKLTQMGLNAREKEDFITYWAPLMVKNDRNYVHFIFNEDFNERAKMSIEPKPDHIFRVFMIWGKAENADENVQSLDQLIPKLKREGFSVVEWGGTEINCFTTNN